MLVLHAFLQTCIITRIFIQLQHNYYTYVSINIQNAKLKTAEKIQAHSITTTQNDSVRSQDSNGLTPFCWIWFGTDPWFG
jgi:hypothetical protein